MKPASTHLSNTLFSIFLSLLMSSPTLFHPALANECDARPILKSVESVVFLSEVRTHKVLALVDTGAELSSLDTELAHSLGLDQNILREVLVRNAHGVSKRPVVKLRFLLQGKVHEAEFTLVSRSAMSHAVLLGRQSLHGFLVDPEGE